MDTTAKNFVLQLGSLIALYVSIGFLIALIFGVINLAYPDFSQYPWESDSASSSIRAAIASLVVFFPTFLVLTRIINKTRRTEGGSQHSALRWLVYLSLLVGGGVLLGDLVAVINNFLNGELTTRFFLKALTVLVVVGLAFIYYLRDVRGYWRDHEAESKKFGVAAAVLVLAALILGFMTTEAPSTVRERSIDERVISDLSLIQNGINDYYYAHNALPETLATAFPEQTYLPEAPTGREAYSYAKTGDTSYALCAQFGIASDESAKRAYPTWVHKAGHTCFDLIIPNNGKPLSTEPAYID